jgi:predicted ferric reductase
MRATGAHKAADANTMAGAIRTTGALQAASALRTTGAMRTAKPIAPGTGKARLIWPYLLLSLIAAGFLGVVYLWWRDTLFQHGRGALILDIGEVLGLIGGYGVVMLVALMSRLPPLEKAVGTDRLARWHATGGRWIITAISGHVVFIIVGQAAIARASVPGETITMERQYPDILMATVAWLLLLMVAAFSMRAARRRIAYETWYYAHLYTYLAIALAFSHQFANGGAFAESLQARVAWSALYVVVGGMLLWYRVITPLRNAARHQFTVQSVRPEAPGIVSVLISGRDFDHLRAEPGQFFRWRFLTRELWWQSHPYSLSAMPQPDLMRITVKASGDHSGSVANLPPGTRIIAEGPYGAFTPSLTGRRILFIAGGVGITPIRAMFAALPKRMSGGITLLYRASHPRDVVFSRELNAIANDRQAALHYLIGSREELGFDPLDADHLQQTVPGLHRYEAYVCGPSGMTQAAVNALVEAGVPRRRIHHESFDF